MKVIILAILQGITEFLPVSSSGHLVIAERLMEVRSPGLGLEVGLHIGTLLSVFVYYRKRIAEIIRTMFSSGSDGQRYAAAVIIGTIPIYFFGFLARNVVGAIAEYPLVVAALLVVNGSILMTLLLKLPKKDHIGFLDAILIGLAQSFAILPGISRAGCTIVMARHLGIEPQKAAEFSLLLFIPAVMGSVAYTALKVASEGLGEVSAMNLGAGIAVAAVVGYAAIMVLVKALSSSKFWMFGIYCAIAGIGGMALFA